MNSKAEHNELFIVFCMVSIDKNYRKGFYNENSVSR